MNTQNNSIVIANEQSLDLPMPDRADVKELALRLQKFDPTVRKFGQELALRVAQLALLYGANPFPGPAQEVHVWEGGRMKNANGQWVDAPPVVYFGIHYYRRMATDRIAWTRQPQVDPNMIVEEGDIAAYCVGARFQDVRELVAMGAPFNEAKQAASMTGFARVSLKDRTDRNNNLIDPPKGRTWEWVAEKRCEMDLYRALSIVNVPRAFVLSDFEGVRESARELRASSDAIEHGDIQPPDVDDINAIFFDDEDYGREHY